MNVDRYITDEVVEVAWLDAMPARPGREDVEKALRAVLPGILAQHRADVLREASAYVGMCVTGEDAAKLLRLTTEGKAVTLRMGR